MKVHFKYESNPLKNKGKTPNLQKSAVFKIKFTGFTQKYKTDIGQILCTQVGLPTKATFQILKQSIEELEAQRDRDRSLGTRINTV